MPIFGLTEKMSVNKTRGMPLPPRLCRLMSQLSSVLGVKEFILFGGVAIDLIKNPFKQTRDLDIGVGGGKKYISQCKKRLRLSGYRIIGKDRPYFINMTDPVTMVFARNDRWLLDISFMNNVLDVGQFDIETLVWRYPELDYIDRYHAIEALRKKTIKPVHELYKENPYLLVNRIINLCSKYNMGLYKNPVHRRLIKILKQRISLWRPPNKFHDEMARAAHYSTILKSINRVKNRQAFIKDLTTTRLLLQTMPELQKPLENLSPDQMLLIEKAENKREIARALLSMVATKDRPKLRNRFQMLHMRIWDLEDQKVKLL